MRVIQTCCFEMNTCLCAEKRSNKPDTTEAISEAAQGEYCQCARWGCGSRYNGIVRHCRSRVMAVAKTLPRRELLPLVRSIVNGLTFKKQCF